MTTLSALCFPLQTDRLLLRDFRPADFDDIHAYAVDPQVARYMPWGPNTPDDTRQFLKRAFEAQTASPRVDFGFAIQLRSTSKVVGSASLRLQEPQGLTAEIGYCLRRDHWRQGFVSEAARALVAAGFDTLGLRRIYATCDVRNTGSFGVMRALGMRREGRFRRDRQINGVWRDTYLYAILAEEWRRTPRTPFL